MRDPRAETYIVAMGLCAAGVLAAYAVARLVGTLFPAVEGRTHPITAGVTTICLVAIVLLVAVGAKIATSYFGYMG